MRALKAATAEHHQRLERRVDIESRLRSRDVYRALLERFYGFYRPLEARLAPYDHAFAPNPKTPLLATDIEALGGAPHALPVAGTLPPTSSLPDALGVLYVLESATLGGAVIAKLAERRLGVTRARGGAFFGAYDSRRWTAFQRVVERHGATGAAAVATFENLEEWVCT